MIVGDLTDCNAERIKQLGFKPQKEIIYNKLLPYYDEIDYESRKSFQQIKLNLSKSIILRELIPGCAVWTARLMGYIKLYGLKFSKEDHVALINMLYEVLSIPELEPHLINKFAQTLIILLKKKYLLFPGEIVLNWRVLYELCKKAAGSKDGLCRYYSALEHTLHFLVQCAQDYFSENATEEILEEIKPQLGPLVCTHNAMEYLASFLPLTLPPEKAHFGYTLWFKDIMDMWETCGNVPSWEPQVMKLIANLASKNVGYINWEPHIPTMFTRFLRSFNLPVTYKQYQTSKLQKNETSAIALWIVSALDRENSCQKYLDKFLKTVESYFHPANFGVWFFKLKELLRKLPQCFVQRLQYERYKKLTWETPVPESRKLTEEDIDRFVDSIKGIAMQAIFSKVGCTDASIALQYLATLRPKVIIPEIIERFYSTLDSLTEPHKLTSVLHCLAMVARPLVQGPYHGYPEGPTHVIPLLMATLPGIDANDFKKSFVTIQFILVLVTLVPLVDSSKASEYWSDLTDEEESICAATVNFEDFVVQFFDRIFNFVESSALEATRLEKDTSKRSKIENLAETTLSSVCYSVLSQCSSTIFKVALKKLHTFVTERILEPKVAGKVVATLCKSFCRVNSEETLKNLLPHFINSIISLTNSEEVQKEEILDGELHYNLLILSELVDCRFGILPYVQQLLSVVDRSLRLSSREGFLMGSKLLDHILLTLTTLYPLENRAFPKSYDLHVKDYLPVREWGRPADVNELNLKWHVPGKEERKCVQDIVLKYLPNELEKLEKHISEEEALSRTDLLRSLYVIYGILGAHSMMPVWDEEPLKLVDSVLNIEPWTVTLGIVEKIEMPDGSNVKFSIAKTIHKLQNKILDREEDDTKSLFAVIQIWERLITNKARPENDFEGSWKNFQIAKKIFENPLLKKNMRVVLIDRILLQHESRTENIKRCLTKTHKMILLNLLELSCSHYSKIRTKAQSTLFGALVNFSFSYTVLLPQLLRNLQESPMENHEKFKGSLYVLSGPKQMPIIARYNWEVLQIWLALVKSGPSEKLSVVKLLDTLMKLVHKHFPTMTITMKIPNSCLEKAKIVLLSVCNSTFSTIKDTEIEEGEKILEEKGVQNKKLYLNLLNSLMDAIENNSLHWRYYLMALGFLRDLALPDIPYPARVVKTFLNTLINDSLELRKVAVKSTLYLLTQQKKHYKKVSVDPGKISGCPVPEKPVPGIRDDNLWLQYNSQNIPKTEKEWNEPRYIHKPTIGYFQWPKSLEVYAYPPSTEPRPCDRSHSHLEPEEWEVSQFFSNQKNVTQLIVYFSLEEKKGKDKFSGTKFWMFKQLFRNHEDAFLDKFKPHLENLVVDSHESSQRCAAEIVGGIIKGSKHWPFEKVIKLWAFLGPVIKTALSNMTEETVQDWGRCFASASENRDPCRNHWLLEILMENPFTEKFSFLGCGRLLVLQGALHQQGWRVAELYKRLLEYFEPYLNHSFQNVRQRIAGALVNIFQPDIKFPGGKTLGPHPEDFMKSVVFKLDVLYTFTNNNSFSNYCKNPDSDNNVEVNEISNQLNSVNFNYKSRPDDIMEQDYSDKEAAFRLLKTICQWITGTLTKTHRSTLPEFYLIFPLICSLESYDQDEELVKLCSMTLAALAQSVTSLKDIPLVLKSIKTVAENGSWWARSSVVVFLQVFIFHNMSLVLSNLEWTRESATIVLNLLEDKRVEVREKAAEVLSGLLHCDFIIDTRNLLKSFKKKVKVKGENGTMLQNSELIRVRHSAILGLCSFINSSPYDVPDYVPEIFSVLRKHLNDPHPIPSTIRKTLGDFKRTHHDNWSRHQLKFTETELEILNDLIVPPSYYA